MKLELLHNEGFDKKIKELAEKYGYQLYDIVFIDSDRKAYRYQHIPANRSNNAYSATKMFIMTAIGLLYDEGRIKPEDKVLDYLRDCVKCDYDKTWEKVTIAHCLGHRMGIEKGYLDIDAEDIESDDHTTLAFSVPLVYEPGEVRVYSDAAYYILARVATEACGEPLDNYLSRKLYRPLKFQEVAMTKCPMGYVVGGTGLYCPTADMAKLAMVYMQRGVYDGMRILSEEWVKFAETNEYGLECREGITYGRTGAHGQMICYSPVTNKAFAFHAYQTDGNYEFREVIIRELLTSDYKVE